MIPRADDYATAYAKFRWNVPERCNMAHDACDRHAADPGRVALLALGRRDLPAHAAPGAIELVADLPRTTTGKIMRRELRRREVDRQRARDRGRRAAAPSDAGAGGAGAGERRG